MSDRPFSWDDPFGPPAPAPPPGSPQQGWPNHPPAPNPPPAPSWGAAPTQPIPTQPGWAQQPPPAQQTWGAPPPQPQSGWTAPPQPQRAAQPHYAAQQHPAPQWGQPAQPMQPWGAYAQPAPPWGPPAAPKKSHRRLLTTVLVAVLVIGLGVGGVVGYNALYGYQNDSYAVPAVDPDPQPVPEPSRPQVEEWRTAHALYSERVPNPVRCDRLPSVDARTSSARELEGYYNELMGCEMRVWDKVLQGSGDFHAVRPSVTVYSDQVTTPCGTRNGGNAFYCMRDQQIYIALDFIRDFGDIRASNVVIAHEFGHAVQGRAGILSASNRVLENTAQNDPAGYVEYRRRELQADCFAGLFLNATAKSMKLEEADLAVYYETWRSGGSTREDKNTHGTPESRHYWGQLGLSTDEIGKCNTWAAGEEQLK